MPNLKYLYASTCGLTDLSPLASVTSLICLNVSGNSINDISVISKLPNLKILNASYNKIADSTPVQGREWIGLDLSNQNIYIEATAGSTITLPEIFRATLDPSNVMYIPSKMQYVNAEKGNDNTTAKIGNGGISATITIGTSKDNGKSFSMNDEGLILENSDERIIKSAQGSKLTITFKESEKKDSNEENKDNKNNTEKEEDKNTNTETDKDTNTDNKKNNTVKPKEDDTVSDGSLPFTGKVTIGLAIIIAIITMIIFKYKYKKYIDIK